MRERGTKLGKQREEGRVQDSFLQTVRKLREERDVLVLGSESDLYGAELSQIQFFKPIQMLSSFSIRQRMQAGKCWVFFKCCNGAMFDLSVVCDQQSLRPSLRPKVTAKMLSEVFDSYIVTAVRNTFGRNINFLQNI